MHAHHRQEGQQCRCRQYRKHIAEIGGRCHFDILNHIRIGFAPLNDSLLQNHQILFQKNDICRFLCHINRSIYGNADIRRLHSGSIIDAIPQKANRMPISSQNRNHAGFLVGCQLCKNIRCLCRSCKGFIRHAVQIRAKKHIAHLKPHLLTNGACYLIIIARQNFCCHAMRLQCANGICRGFLRGI